MMATQRPTEIRGDSSRCLVHTVAEVMKCEPALEAVKFDRARRAISVATLGRTDEGELERRLTSQIEQSQQPGAEAACCLVEGNGDCTACDLPPDQAVGRRINVHHEPDVTTITRVTCPTAPRFWRWRNLPWPKVVPRTVELPEEADHDKEWKQQMVAAVLCGLFALAGWQVGRFHGEGLAAASLFVVAYLAGAWFTVHEVWERLRDGVLDVHFLMLAVAVGSASIGAWEEGATLLFLFSFSGALEHYAMGRTHKEIRSLFKSAPKTATLVDAAGRERVLPVEDVEAGMRLLIKPGEQFPVDAEIVKGKTAADESNLTGEATPVEKGRGDSVLGGTINLWGAVETVALRGVQESALKKIIRLIQEAQHLKAPSQRFTDKFSTHYTYAILGLSLAMFFIWWLGLGHAPFLSSAAQKSAFYLSMTLLVVASPCALVLSIPSAVLAAIAWGARRGILFRGGAAVENLAEVQVVAMDKTGTLTTGELRVENVESFPPGREGEVAELAYSLERLSTHPLARAITRYGKQQGLKGVELAEVESVTGLGLRARLNGKAVVLGRREWLLDSASSTGTTSGEGACDTEGARRWIAQVAPTEAGFSEVWLLHCGLVGRVLLRDDIRPEAQGLVQRLRELGLQSLVLTGDRRATAEHLKRSLGLDDVRAELKPEQKVEAIAAFVQQGRRVAMVGDGVNDAPSLAAADVGVAMGARGSDAALEQAEVVLMHDRLENFLTAFRLSQRARTVIRQNLIISLGTVVVLVGCALLGKIPLTLGVVGHEGSTVVVVLNSLRLLFGRAKR
jgi:Zn2+/Cd2+-exporting ATPase